ALFGSLTFLAASVLLLFSFRRAFRSSIPGLLLGAVFPAAALAGYAAILGNPFTWTLWALLVLAGAGAGAGWSFGADVTPSPNGIEISAPLGPMFLWSGLFLLTQMAAVITGSLSPRSLGAAVFATAAVASLHLALLGRVLRGRSRLARAESAAVPGAGGTAGEGQGAGDG
ncbi:MAG: hypothetical protein HYR98_10000, partial [Nitrospirae bacterium]|nr:hypothetical protein [Nitrospirota bacterium]